MQLANQISLPGAGVSVPVITGEPVAGWVSEGGAKPVSDATVSNKLIQPHKIAVIEVFSEEFARDLPGLYGELVQRLPQSLAKKFDDTVFHATTAPGSNFDLLSAAGFEVLAKETAWEDLVAAEGRIAVANGIMTGIALSPKGRSVLNGAVDGAGRPLFLNDVTRNGAQTILGADVVLSRAAYKADAAGDNGEVLGIAGDWSSAFYGTVEGVKVKVSDQAVVGGVSMFQTNQIAVLAEIEVGFAVRNLAHFIKLTGANTVA